MPFLHDLRIILVASAEMFCSERDSPITCMQLVSVFPSWDVVDWTCLEDTMSLLSLVTVWACRPKDSSALDTKVGWADGLAQLVELRTTVREVSGSRPRPDQHSGS